MAGSDLITAGALVYLNDPVRKQPSSYFVLPLRKTVAAAISTFEVFMESASYFAKKHGLEQYLEKPDELNEMILKLMVLQETMQAEEARKKRAEGADCETIAVKRTAGGKFSIRCAGDAAYRYAVVTAFQGSTALVPLFQRGRFISLLRRMGVPEERIAEYCSTIVVDDDTLCIDQD